MENNLDKKLWKITFTKNYGKELRNNLLIATKF